MSSPTYLKRDLVIKYGTESVLGSELAQLKISELLAILRQLELDIASIKLQLKKAKSSGNPNPDWIQSASNARVLKGAHYHTIKQTIAERKQSERERIRDTAELFRQVAKEILPPTLFTELDRIATERHSQPSLSQSSLSKSTVPLLAKKDKRQRPNSMNLTRNQPTKNPQSRPSGDSTG